MEQIEMKVSVDPALLNSGESQRRQGDAVPFEVVRIFHSGDNARGAIEQWVAELRSEADRFAERLEDPEFWEGKQLYEVVEFPGGARPRPPVEVFGG